MDKNLGCFLLAATILGGCNDSASELEIEREIKAETKTEINTENLKQQELMNTYEKYIEDDEFLLLLKDFYRKFVEKETEINLNDEIIEVYNKGIRNLIEKNGVEQYHDYSSWLSKDFIDENTEEFIQEKLKNYENESLAVLTDFIDSYNHQSYDLTKVDKIKPYGYLDDNEEIQTLIMFINALIEKNSESPIPISSLSILLENVNPNYSGIKEKEIKDFIKDKEISLNNWEDIYSEANDNMLTEEEDIIDYNPSIGMTVEEVINSTLGKPNSINRTVTANSVREQWVYGNGLYLYFEDGIFTSFQD